MKVKKHTAQEITAKAQEFREQLNKEITLDSLSAKFSRKTQNSFKPIETESFSFYTDVRISIENLIELLESAIEHGASKIIVDRDYDDESNPITVFIPGNVQSGETDETWINRLELEKRRLIDYRVKEEVIDRMLQENDEIDWYLALKTKFEPTSVD